MYTGIILTHGVNQSVEILLPICIVFLYIHIIIHFGGSLSDVPPNYLALSLNLDNLKGSAGLIYTDFFE